MPSDSIDNSPLTSRSWCLSPGVLAKHWADGTTVVFHAPSGSTHQLSPVGAFLIEALSACVLDELTLQQQCKTAFSIEDGSSLADILVEALQGLAALSLVEQVDS